MLKKTSLIIISVLVIGSVFVGCSKTTTTTPTQGTQNVQVKQVDENEILKKQAQKYYDGLSSDTRNLIEPKDLLALVEAGSEDIFIYDIRKDEDFAAGHIKGAKHMWWFDGDKMLDQLPKDKTIVVTCYTGQSAGQVVGVLRMMGYDAIAMTGGMTNGWEAQGLPKVTD